MSLQHIQKNSPRLLHTPAKFEKNPPQRSQSYKENETRSRRSQQSLIFSHIQRSVACGTLNQCYTMMLHIYNPPTNVHTKYHIPTPYGFRDIARTIFYRSRSLWQSQIKIIPWHCKYTIPNQCPTTISTSYTLRFLRYSRTNFSRHPVDRPPTHPDTMGENNTPTDLKGCRVKRVVLVYYHYCAYY